MRKMLLPFPLAMSGLVACALAGVGRLGRERLALLLRFGAEVGDDRLELARRDRLAADVRDGLVATAPAAEREDEADRQNDRQRGTDDTETRHEAAA